MIFYFLNSKAIHFFSSASLSQIHYKQMGGRDPLRNLPIASGGKLPFRYCCMVIPGDEILGCDFFLSLTTE